MAALVAIAGLGSAVAAGAQDDRPSPGTREGASPSEQLSELPALRTRTSRVYAASDGTRIARVYAEPRHFRDETGSFSTINPKLEPDGPAFSSSATEHELTVPGSATAPVRFARGDAWASFALMGEIAPRPAVVDGTGARYRDVLPGVDLEYRSLADGVKEEIVLRERSAPSVYRFAVETSPGLVARERGRAIAFVDARGRERFSFNPPFMVDSSAGDRHGKVEMSLEPTGDAFVVTLRADRGWLDAPERRYPVRIDPSISNASNSCFLSEWSSTTTHCEGDLEVGGTPDPLHEDRALVRFDMSGAMPSYATVISAWASMELGEARTSTPISVSAHRVTSPWSADDVSWANADAGEPWTAPGGDFDAEAESQTLVDGEESWYEWPVAPEVVQHWIDVPEDNHGLLFKGPGREAQNHFTFEGGGNPSIEIRYKEPGSAHPTKDCTLAASTPSASDCDGEHLKVGAAGGEHRTLIRFGAHRTLPAGARILSARAELQLDEALTGSAIPVAVHRVTRDWGTEASWLEAEPGEWWQTEGGDYEALPLAENPSVGPAPGPYSWSLPPEVVQDWLDHSDDNFGVLFRGPGGGAANDLSFTSVDGGWAERPQIHAEIEFDQDRPELTQIDGPDDSEWFDEGDPVTTTLHGEDPRGGVRWFRLDFPGGNPAEVERDCGIWHPDPRCEHVDQETFEYPVDETRFPIEGRTVTWASVRDAGGNAAHAEPVRASVDRTPPELDFSGSTLNQGGEPLDGESYELDIRAIDGSDGHPDDERSGAKSIRVLMRAEPLGQFETKYFSGDVACPEGSCELERSWELRPADHDPGKYTVRVVARDQLDHERVHDFAVVIPPQAPAPDLQDDRIGLERWWQYDSTETGAETAAHVNLSNGNLVWHSTPVANPGRGLSTVVNLTYNSWQRVQLPLVETPLEQGLEPYNEAGRGFSIGISGLTRVNERLNVDLAAAGRITLTDPDGTRHLFRAEPGSNTEVFTPPPGVQLHLRRFSKAEGIVEPPAVLGYTPLEQPAKAWAATRPDGVTHYFDQRGYQTSVEDRNGNVLQFDYEYRSPTRSVCEAAAESSIFVLPVTACPRKLVSVTDAGGRELGVGYEKRVLADLPAELIPTGGLPPELAGETLETDYYASGRIKTITDHAGRVLELGYNVDRYLTSMTEAVGTADERELGFSYEQVQAPLSMRPLASVTDSRGNQTQIAYEPRTTGDSLNPELLLFDRAVAQVTDRAEAAPGASGASTLYEIDQLPSGASDTTVTDTRDFETDYQLDELGRMTSMTDARETRTELVWDDATTNDNNVAQVTEAEGTEDEAVTTLTYNANGNLLTSEDPNGHRTDLTYFDSAGHPSHQSPRTVGDPGVSIDAGGTFVSDLATLTRPRGTESSDPDDLTSFEYSPDERGNVVAVTDASGATATAAYGANGVITEETDPVGNPTEYSDHDANGLPRTVEDARHKVWRYCYDAVANVTRATDPRGEGQHSCTAGNQGFSTELRYDALDRLRTEIVPKRSSAGQYITREYEYDPNDNLTTRKDGTTQTWLSSYTPMDLAEEQQTPATDHVEGNAREVTQVRYDDEENPVRVVAPKGVATSGVADDFTTEYRYDSIGERVAELRLAPGDTPSQLATSFAYDRRGNVIGLADPRHNEAGGDPAANVLDPAKRRFTFEYDAANNRTAEIEDPSGEALRTEYGYDANDNVETVTDPRGTATAQAGDFTTRFGYDERDLPVSTLDAEDRLTEVARRADGRVSAITKPKGTATAGAPHDYETAFDYFPTGELKERTIPHAQNQYGSNSLKVSYAINDVGDPETITDAAGHEITNDFLDTGELLTTTRPSWWALDGAGVRERSPEEMGGTPREASLPGSEGQGDFGSVDPQGDGPLLPLAGATSFGYDDELRLTSITDAATKTVQLDRDEAGRLDELRRPIDDTRDFVETFEFDLNGNQARLTDPEGHVTSRAFDQFDRLTSETGPGANAGAETTTFSYDANGNRRFVETPRGPVWEMAYDAVDRQSSIEDPEDNLTTFDYDRAGNRIGLTSPRGNALAEAERGPFRTHFEFNEVSELTKRTDGAGHEWRFDYDADGNQIEVDAPPIKRNADAAEHRQVTTRTFDGRDLLWTETTGAGDNGEDRARTRVFEFDPNGSLRRMVNPRGIDAGTGLPEFTYTEDDQVSSSIDSTKHATVYEYEGADPSLLTSVRLPWGDRDTDDQVRYTQKFGHDDRGRVDTIDPPRDFVAHPTPPLAARTTYTHFATGWIRSAHDHYQDFDYDYDKRGLQALWRVTDDATQNVRRVDRLYWPSGALKERTGQKRLSGVESPEYTYTYEYDPNGSLASMHDDRKNRTTTLAYDDADRQTLADEQAFNVAEVLRRGKDTVLAYDRNGNVVERLTDGRVQPGGTYLGGKTTTFTYDSLDREQTMEVVAGGELTRTTSTDYWPGGERSLRRTERELVDDDTVERWFRFSDGRLSRMDRKRQGATEFLKQQAYDYDLNGNRIQDERGAHEFNARDQLVLWNPDVAGKPDVAYRLNGSGGIVERAQGGETTSYHYLAGAERLDHAVTTVGGQSARTDYSYAKGFGDVTSYRLEGAAEPAAEFDYDAFGRQTRAERGTKVEDFSYDGLDRRDTREVGAKFFDLSYVGLSEALSQEVQFVGGDERRSYDYTSGLERVGTARKPDGAGGDAPYRAYSLDANGSVEGMQDDTGDDSGHRYRYDPYGQALDSDGDLMDDADEATLPEDQQANPFRFQGHYYDAAFKTYDMRARAYLPEIGRFLQEDHYEQASGDQALETDPLTQDRYAFAAANPTTNIEFDGHYAGTTDQNSRTIQTQGGDVIDRSKGRTVAGPRRGSGPGNSGWTPRSTRQAARGFRRFDALVRARHVPPTGQLTRAAAERFLAGFEGAHDLTIGGPGGIDSLERESYLTALQQGDWYDIVGQLGGNPAASAAFDGAMMAPLPGPGGAGKQCVQRCRGLAAAVGGWLRRRLGLSAAKTRGGADEAFHYTRSEVVDLIEKNGLRPGSYLTKKGDLSPLQAQIDLALPPNRGLPGATIRVDLAGMRKAGYDIGDFTRVGRKYNMPGGGTELQFEKAIPPRFLSVVRR